MTFNHCITTKLTGAFYFQINADPDAMGVRIVPVLFESILFNVNA